jgi:hypothetical protein
MFTLPPNVKDFFQNFLELLFPIAIILRPLVKKFEIDG